MSEPAPKHDDFSGRSRFSRNVAFAWGGYLVNILSGFIIPRLIGDRLGQHTLGIWDFTWSIYSYFSFLQFGIGASTGRYIARHRAQGDMQALSRSVSTISLSFFVSGCLVLLAALATPYWVLPAFGEKLGADLQASQWTLFFLGIEGSLTIILAAYDSVITGLHRWDIHNTIGALTYGLTLVGMITAIAFGAGLPALAAIHCVMAVAGQMVRWRLVRCICPELRVDFSLASLAVWKEQFHFGAKSLIPRFGELLSNQTLNLLIATCLGPAMLAIYSRPKSLLRSLQVFSAKYGSIVVPISSSLQASSNHEALRDTLLKTTGFIACLTLPAALTLQILGDWVIRLWMGPGYVYPGLLSVLAISSFFTIVQEPIWSILVGINRHGRIALAKIVGAGCSVMLLGVGLIWFKWNLIGAAFAFALPNLVVDGWITPRHACRCLGISPFHYFRNALIEPLACSAFYLGCLLLARFVFAEQPWFAAGLLGLGLVVLLWTLWRVVVPPSRREVIIRRFSLSKSKPFLRESVQNLVDK